MGEKWGNSFDAIIFDEVESTEYDSSHEPVDYSDDQTEGGVTKVLCRNCQWYDPIIHSCERIDREAGAFVSYVFDDCWCSVEEGAVYTTDEEFEEKWWGVR